MAIGGALGAAAGTHEGQALKTFVEKSFDLPITPTLKGKALAKKARENALLDLAFTGGAKVLSTAYRLGKGGLALTFGVRKEGFAAAKTAKDKFGIELGIGDVSRSGFAGFLSQVFGRFPLTAAPFTKAARRKGEQILDAQTAFIGQFGPVANMAKLGVVFDDAAFEVFKQFDKGVSRRYKLAYDTAINRGSTVATNVRVIDDAGSQTSLRLMAAESADKLIARRGVSDVAGSEVFKFFKKIEELPNQITFAQFKGLMEEIGTLAGQRSTSATAKRLLFDFKGLSEQSLSKVGDPTVAKLFKEADDFLSQLSMDIFQTSTAKKFEQVTVNRFGAGRNRPGSQPADRLFDNTMKMDSPEAVRDLKKLLGKREIFGRAVGTKLDDIFEQARVIGEDNLTKSTLLNPQRGGGIDVSFVRKQLGLDRPKSTKNRAWAEALKGQPHTLADVGEFIDLVELALKNAPPGVNAFAARRITLGGFRSLKSLLLPGVSGAAAVGAGAASGIGVPGSLAIIAATRFTGNILASPRMMRMTKTALDETVPLQRRRAVLRILYNTLVPDDPEELNEAS